MNATTTPLKEAERFYNLAQEALLRPEEDIVPYQICENAYNAVRAYLNYYLTTLREFQSPSAELEELFSACISFDPTFREIPLNQMFRPTSNEDVWMSLNTARLFLDLAEKTRQKVSQS